MSAATTRLRAVRALLSMCSRSDPWRAALGFAPIYPIATGVTFLAARRLLTALPENDRGAIVGATAVFLAAWIGTVVLGRIGNTVRVRLQELTRLQFEQRLAAAVLSVEDIERLEDPGYLDALHVLRTRIIDLMQAPRVLGWIVDGGGGLLVSLALLVAVDPRLVFVVLAGVPATLVNGRSQRAIERVRDAEAGRGRRAAHLFDIATASQNGKEIRVNRLHEELLARYGKEWRATDRAMLRAELRAALMQAAAWTAAVAAFAVGVALLLDGVQAGTITAGDIFITLGVMTAVVNQVGGAAAGVSTFRRTIRVIERLVMLEDIAREARDDEAARQAQLPAELHTGIELDRVTYRYAGATDDALRGISLRLPVGGVIAVVGDNGAGKSTLVKLLFGLYRPSGGRITVDGVDLRDIPTHEWRARTSACFQDFLNVEFTAQESVGTGYLPRVDDAAHVTAALHRAAATDVIEALPEGLETRIGTKLRGRELSGGQWQKIAIARAMTRLDPLLLALDEPTSAIDPLSELELFRRYAHNARELAGRVGTVTVIVSHRFSTVRSADLIVVLDDGQIIETGTHDALMTSGGLYAEMYDLQARHYR